MVSGKSFNRAARRTRSAAVVKAANGGPLTSESRQRLRELRTGLLQLHKTLLDDARKGYELDRGSIGSRAALLQLVIHDSWFAWLHQLSELVVRQNGLYHNLLYCLEKNNLNLSMESAKRS